MENRNTSYVVNTMASDDLAMQGARAPAGCHGIDLFLLTWCSFITRQVKLVKCLTSNVYASVCLWTGTYTPAKRMVTYRWVSKKRNPSALAMWLRLSCINPSICCGHQYMSSVALNHSKCISNLSKQLLQNVRCATMMVTTMLVC